MKHHVTKGGSVLPLSSTTSAPDSSLRGQDPQGSRYPSGASHIKVLLLQLTPRRSAKLVPLQRAQNAAPRLVFELGTRDHVTTMQSDTAALTTSPLHWRIQFKLCCMMHCVFMATAPHI